MDQRALNPDRVAELARRVERECLNCGARSRGKTCQECGGRAMRLVSARRQAALPPDPAPRPHPPVGGPPGA